MACFFFRITFNTILLIFIFSLFLKTYASVSEAQVFDWWDAGIITPDEAYEILDLINEGNTSEACILAEVYAQEPCEETKQKKKSKKKEPKKKKSNLKPSGYALVKIQLDSLGKIKKHHEEIQIKFYRYTFRFGSQKLLTYQNEKSEAHFGEISTKEIHSHIPLDTLWGTSILYPIGDFYIGGLVDTSIITQAKLGYNINKKNSIETLFWLGNQSNQTFQSIQLQTKLDIGEASLWYQHKQFAPLVKIQFRNTKNPINFRTTAYYHKDSVPAIAKLSPSILKSRLWGAQTISGSTKSMYPTKFDLNMRFINPLHSDSLLTRIKGSVQTGPDKIRISMTLTCLELNNNCNDTDGKLSVQSNLNNSWLIGGASKIKYSKDKSFNSPRLESFIRYEDSPSNYAKISLIIPNSAMTNRIYIQNEAHFFSDFLEFEIATTFKKLTQKQMYPSHGSLTVKVNF